MISNDAVNIALGCFAAFGVVVMFVIAWTQRRKMEAALKHAQALESSIAAIHAEALEVGQAAQNAQNEASLALHRTEQAQQFAAVLIESAAMIIMAVDEDGHLRLFNERAEDITGYKREELFDIDWLETLFPGEDFEPAREGLRAVLRGELVGTVETLLVAKNGDERTISWQCRKVIYRDEALRLLFGVDLTDRSLAERERQELERKLLDMQKLESLGVLAGGIAHDFNNLLTAILGNAQLARLQLQGSSPLQQNLLEIERTSIQAADLCKQMLASSGLGRM